MERILIIILFTTLIIMPSNNKNNKGLIRMIAMPVKTNKEDSAVSPVFGKVKFFALVDDNNNIKFIENVEKSGSSAINLLISHGVKTLLMSHIGMRPFQMAISSGIDIYFVGKERVTISEAVEKFKNGEYPNAKDIDSSLFASHSKSDHHHHH